ncbi:ParB N-terminal domain-containing protein [Dongia sp.]|uniref:ParB N-terminal domain-containing protein n=1 Tax=Dongia sp. TaxID=1977262 RepID=UPI0035AE6A91
MKSLGLQKIDISKIDADGRLRPISPAHAALIADNIRETSLRNPIEVRTAKGGRFKLIAGGHRLAAIGLLKHPTIDAFVFEANDDEARIAEIDENLVRHELNPLDRAVFLAERKAIYERLHPAAKQGGDRKSKAAKDQTETISVWSFAKDTADKVGLTDRAIRLAVSIATGLSPESRAAIAGTAFALKQAELLALAKLTPVQQRKALAGLLGDAPKFHSVRQAADNLTGRKPKAVDGYARLVTSWRHATGAERREFLAFLNKEGELRLAGRKEAA